MKPFYSFLFLLFPTCIASSCHKDHQPVKPANEGTILTAHTSLSGVDKLILRSYVRNAADRLILYRDSAYFAYNSRTFEYDADGRVSRVNLYNEYGALLDHFELEYNSNGKVIKRTDVNHVDPQPSRYNTYTYDASGKLLVDSLFVPTPAGYTVAYVVKLYYTGDNVTESEFYTNNGINGLYLNFRMKFEYDNKINPLQKVPNYYCLTALGGSAYFTRYESKNNVIKEYHASGNQPYGLVFTYKYKYNSSGYPYLQEPGFAPDGRETKRVEYFYK